MFDQERFWSKVSKRGEDECWPWTGGRCQGYGRYGYKGKVWNAHIVAFAIHNSIIPTGVLIRHTCNNRLCCNPRHLIDGTHADNKHDSVLAGTAKNRNNPGVLHHNTILLDEDIQEIRRLGIHFSAYYIAKLPQFKGRITESGIRQILQGKTWKGV